MNSLLRREKMMANFMLGTGDKAIALDHHAPLLGRETWSNIGFRSEERIHDVRLTYVAHIPPLRGWYSRDSLCYGVRARVMYITAKKMFDCFL